MLYFNQAKKRTNRFVPLNSREVLVFKSTSVDEYKDSCFGAIMIGKSMKYCICQSNKANLCYSLHSQGNILSKSISQKNFPERSQVKQPDEIVQLPMIKTELTHFKSLSPRGKINFVSPVSKNMSLVQKNLFTPLRSEENFTSAKTPKHLIDQKVNQCLV